MTGLIKLLFDRFHHFVLRNIKGDTEEEKLKKYNNILITIIAVCFAIIVMFGSMYLDYRRSTYELIKNHNELLNAVDYNDGNLFSKLIAVNGDLNYSLQKCNAKYIDLNDKTNVLKMEITHLKKIIANYPKNGDKLLEFYEMLYDQEAVENEINITYPDVVMPLKKIN